MDGYRRSGLYRRTARCCQVERYSRSSQTCSGQEGLTASDTLRRVRFDRTNMRGNGMPPDDTEGLEEADLPGLDEADSSELVEADLPGLDDDSPDLDDGPSPGKPEAPPEKAEPPEGNPLDRVDEAIHNWESDLDAAKAKKVKAKKEWWPKFWAKEVVPGTPQPSTGDRVDDSDVDDLQSVVLGDVDYEQRHRAPESFRPRFYFPFKIRLIVGGFGVMGLVLMGVFFFDGSDEADNDAVAVPSVAPVEETVAPSTEPAVADTEVPAAAVAAPEAAVGAVVADPADYATITDWAVLVDVNGDVWIVATPAAPWLPGPDADTAFGLTVGIGIDLGYQTNTSWRTLYDGSTRAESSIVGADIRAALGGEVWVTPDGDLAVKLPGTSPTAGLSLTDLGPDAAIYLYGQLWPEEGSETQIWEETRPLGPVTQVTDPLPLPDWLREELDFYEPITLIIPAG